MRFTRYAIGVAALAVSSCASSGTSGYEATGPDLEDPRARELLGRFAAAPRSEETERLFQPYIDRAINDPTRIMLECRGAICRVTGEDLSPAQYDDVLRKINTDRSGLVFKEFMVVSKPGSRVAYYELEDTDTVVDLKRRRGMVRQFLASPALAECRRLYPASGDMVFALDVEDTKLVVSHATGAVSGPDTECVRKALMEFVEKTIPLDLVALRAWSIVVPGPTASIQKGP